jgi:Transglycosylase SLT domain
VVVVRIGKKKGSVMSYRRIKFIFIPDQNGQVKQFKVPVLLSALLLFLLTASVAALSLIIADYAKMKPRMGLIEQLERENERQRLELLAMSQNVVRVVRELDELQAINSEEEILHNLARNFDDGQGRRAGNHIESALLSDRISRGAYSNLAGEVKSALAYVASEIDIEGMTASPVPRKVAGVKGSKATTSKVRLADGNRATIRKQLRTVAMELGLAPRLALSMARVESGYDHRAVSPKGAIGVLQLLPQYVCREYDVTPDMLFDPEVNIRIGLEYMKWLLKRFNENLDLSLAAYNAGPRRVVEAGYGIPAIGETRDYVRKVKEAMRSY